MRDLSVHILDAAQNSIRAKAKNVALSVTLDEKGMLTISVLDDGAGMSPETLEKAQSPFFTTRAGAKVGLGIPLLAENCRLAGGTLTIESQPGRGTKLTATMDTSNVDCLPIGDLAATVTALVCECPKEPDFTLRCQSPTGEAQFDAREIRAALQGARLDAPEVAAWIRQTLREEIEPIFGGVLI